MDAAVRHMLIQAENEQNDVLLREAFEKLRRGRKITGDHTDPFSSDLYVVCAEVSIKLGNKEIVEECIKLYFQKTPPNNQFLCRAYLCQAQLHAPVSCFQQEKLVSSTGSLLKAIAFAKTNTRYHFLVYNASVLYWAFARPFMKPNFRHLLAKSLHVVVKALDEVNDEDYEWRAHLMIAVMECHIDAGRKDDALHVGQAALQFTKSFVSHMCKEVFTLQIRYKLIDPGRISSITKSSSELMICYKILKLRSQTETSAVNTSLEIGKIFKLITDGEDTSSVDTRSTNSSRTFLPLLPAEKNSLLLDLLRLCLDKGQPEAAEQCVDELQHLVADDKLMLQIDFLKCDLMVKKLKEKSESYSKSNIEVRLQAIYTIENHLISANRLNDENTIQMGCLTLWNLCLPLLQHNLRHKIRKQLLLAVEMLENIDSLLTLLRCQMHYEVAKCEEDDDQLQSAITHLLKALDLDDSQCYKARLEHSLQRIKLKAVLYQLPERAEDHAAMIIEQAESSVDAKTSFKMRNYLLKAGMLLAPDVFLLAMDGEEALKVGQASIEKLADKVNQYKKAVSKISGHLNRLEDTDPIERVKLWADLAKTARKQQVWDVARIAATFCLLYDDNRWFVKTVDNPPSKICDGKFSTNNQTNVGNVIEFGVLSREQLGGKKSFSTDSDILRLLAEVNFIYAEALVQLLQSEGLHLLQKAKAPEDNKLRPKKYQNNPVKASEMPEWLIYSDWIDDVSTQAINQFQRAAIIGVELKEPWIVCNAGIYVWNYTKHLLSEGKYSSLTKVFRPLFTSLQSVGHDTEAVFLCDLTNAIALGYLQPYIPQSYYEAIEKCIEDQSRTSSKDKKEKLGTGSNHHTSLKSKAAASSVHLAAGAVSEVKEAVDIVEYTLNVTSGAEKRNIVPITVRHKLIKTWVLCKGLLNQQLPRNYGHDNDAIDSQGPMSKALCAVEALSLHAKHVADFPSCSNISEVIKLVKHAKWTDQLLLLQVWTQLALVGYNSNMVDIAVSCCDTALNTVNGSDVYSKKYRKKKTSLYKHNCLVEQEMLCYASTIKGQCLVVTMNGRMEVRRLALECFVNACKHGGKAENYDLVMSATRHYWNTVYQLISVPIERKLLKEPIKTILDCVTSVAKNVFDNKDGNNKTDSTKKISLAANVNNMNSSTEAARWSSNEKTTLEEDLRLRAALYSVLFQTFADKGEFNDGLLAMDQAIKVMPRTHHRLLIFKHRVITQAKLSKPVQFDMGKFRDESESVLSQMWQRVANYSTHPKDQMSAYINAIDVLTKDENTYQRVDYLAEFGEWLFVNEYPVQKAVDQLLFAISLLVNGLDKSALSPSSSFISFKDDMKFLQNVKDIFKMDILIRLYVMISEMVGRQNELYQQYNLAAAYLVQHMWKTAITNAEKAVKEGIKPGEAAPPKKNNKGSREYARVEKSSSRSSLPSTIELWATYQIPDKLKEHFTADKHGLYISKSSIQKPMLSLYYLEKLTENLASIGFHHLSVQVMLLRTYIAKELVGNRSLLLLMYMRSCELYRRLNMNAAYERYHSFLQEPILTEEDQEKSREEIEVWEEKQRQVRLEELRQGSETKLITAQYLPSSTCKPELGKVLLRDVWAKIAEYLIEQSQYQSARKLLEEASLSAVAFDDDETQQLINYNFALIAYHEKDWGKAISFLQHSKVLCNSQTFWMKKILLLVDSLHNFSKQDTTFQSHLTDDGLKNSKSVLENAIATIDELIATKKNCTHLGPYIKARFLSHLGMILYTESKEKRYKTLSDKTEFLQNACYYLEEGFKQLSELGYKRESIEMMFLQVEIRKKLALSQQNEQVKKRMLLETVKMAHSAVENVTIVAAEITDLSKRDEVGNIFLPIQHDIITARVHCIDVMYEITKVALEEKKMKRLKEEGKEYIVRLIDNYIETPPELTSFDVTWLNTISSIPQEAMMLSAAIHSLTNKLPTLHAKAALQLGLLLSMLARYNNEDHFDAWTHHQQEIVQGDHISCTPSQMHRLTSQDDQLYELQDCIFFSSQAVESLLQAIQIGLHHKNTIALQKSSLQLLDLVGTRDAYFSVQLLALYQSTGAAIAMEKVLKRAFIDPHTSESAALMAQHEQLRKSMMGGSNASSHLNSTAMNNFEWCKRLSISKNHFEILKDIPFNITYVLLQHSYDQNYVYGGVMERHRPSTAAKKKDSSPASRATIARQSTSPELLSKLLEMCSEYKSMVAGELMRQIYARYQRDRRKELLGKKFESEEATLQEKEATEHESEKISETFDALVTAIEAYFGNVLTQIQKSFEQDTALEFVVLLADEHLLELPLEAMSIFKKPEIKSLSRDFSLQMFYHRFKQGEPDAGRQSKADQKTPSKGKPDAKATKSDKGGSPATKRKITADKKAGGKEFVIDKDNIMLDISNLKYLVDPLNDGFSEPDRPEVTIDRITNAYKQTSKWTGIKGYEEVSNVKDMQTLLRDSTGFLFLGYERFLSFLPPSCVAAFNLNECHFAVLLDLVKTSSSYLRQGNLDAAKSPSDLLLENPVQTSMILSLCGICALALNQWNSSLKENEKKLETILSGLWLSNFSVGQAIRAIVFPQKTNPPEDKIPRGGSKKKSSTASKESRAASCASEQVDVPSAPNVEGEEVKLNYDLYNMVMYGLPNFVVN